MEKSFPNGDTYTGEFSKGLPHGSGTYKWSNGTFYVGDWEEAKMTGKGRMVWMTGSVYEGEFSGGYFHGHGKFTCPGKYTYTGSWRMNTLHGFGKKEYSNLDYYEGSWREGVREGCGEYVWGSGSTYTGTWKDGKMFGRGVMKWLNGDVFYGFWLNGLRHGSGFYRFTNGGYYFGNWTKGLKDGRGTFYPAGSKHPSVKKMCISAGYDGREKKELLTQISSKNLADTKSSEPGKIKRSVSELASSGSLEGSSHRTSSRKVSFDQDSILRNLAKDLSSSNSSHRKLLSRNQSGVDQSGTKDESNNVIYEREYMQGILIRERVVKGLSKSHRIKQRRKLPMIETERGFWMTIFNGSRREHLMLNLQLGIRYTVGKITPVPAREVRHADFSRKARMKMYFPNTGSRLTPPHYSLDFYWKDYCPMVFRNLREMFKLDAADYMMSICGDDGLRGIDSAGKSGCIFFLSHDDKFVIKTLRKSEVKVMLEMLPAYYEHVKQHENTLITKFFGLHSIKLKHGKRVRFVVMGNMFYTELKIHRRYDLKGSTYGRSTNKEKITETTTLKDLDLSYEFHMDRSLREALFEQLSLDCTFLKSQNIIDYSLLLGVHFRAPNHLMPLLEHDDSFKDLRVNSSNDGISSGEEVVVPPTGLILVTHEPGSVNTAPGPHIRGSTLRAYSIGGKEVDLLLPGTGRLRVQLGVNMPAHANRRLAHIETRDPSEEVELFEVYDVVLYLGIIDILQAYNVRKRCENGLKSVYCDPTGISCVDPELYVSRFISFLEKVFPDP